MRQCPRAAPEKERANVPKTDASAEMTQKEINGIFTTLRLPTELPVAPPPVVQPSITPIVFFTIGGASPPLPTR